MRSSSRGRGQIIQCAAHTRFRDDLPRKNFKRFLLPETGRRGRPLGAPSSPVTGSCERETERRRATRRPRRPIASCITRAVVVEGGCGGSCRCRVSTIGDPLIRFYLEMPGMGRRQRRVSAISRCDSSLSTELLHFLGDPRPSLPISILQGWRVEQRPVLLAAFCLMGGLSIDR